MTIFGTESEKKNHSEKIDLYYSLILYNIHFRLRNQNILRENNFQIKLSDKCITLVLMQQFSFNLEKLLSIKDESC